MDYDQRAVAYVERLERAVPPRNKLDPVAIEIGALFNALETHVESGLGNPNVVQAYEDLFLVLATLRGLDPSCIKKAQAIFHDLRHYLPSGGR